MNQGMRKQRVEMKGGEAGGDGERKIGSGIGK